MGTTRASETWKSARFADQTRNFPKENIVGVSNPGKVTFLTYKTTNPCGISNLAWPGHCSPTPPPPPLGGELK